MEVIIASKNKGKIKEFQQFFSKYEITVKSLLDLNEDIEINETGKTFEENALIKARAISMAYQCPALGDDSGLEVEALNNAPGIYSARYAGVHGDDRLNNEKLLSELKDVPLHKRQARFVCSLALVVPNAQEWVVRGECEGFITHEAKGKHGFGYDPVFYIPSYKQTMAELSPEQKECISHRGDALRKLGQYLGAYNE